MTTRTAATLNFHGARDNLVSAPRCLLESPSLANAVPVGRHSGASRRAMLVAMSRAALPGRPWDLAFLPAQVRSDAGARSLCPQAPARRVASGPAIAAPPYGTEQQLQLLQVLAPARSIGWSWREKQSALSVLAAAPRLVQSRSPHALKTEHVHTEVSLLGGGMDPPRVVARLVRRDQGGLEPFARLVTN
jgi:hypothetical protein